MFKQVSFVFTLVLSIGALSAEAATINVPADVATVQGAIDQAADGDVIVLAAFSHQGPINSLGKAITIRSTDPLDPNVVRGTVLNAGPTPTEPVVTLTSTGLTIPRLEGITIASSEAQGVVITSGNAGLINCRITNNKGGGVRIDGGSTSIFDCDISDNGSDVLNQTQNGGGIAILSNANIQRCTINRNETRSNGGGVFVGPDAVAIEIGDTSIMGNRADLGAGAFLTANIFFTRCRIIGNGAITEGGGLFAGNVLALVSNSIICDNQPEQMLGSILESGTNTIADTCPAPEVCGEDTCPADIAPPEKPNGEVNFDDLIELLNQFGDCL